MNTKELAKLSVEKRFEFYRKLRSLTIVTKEGNIKFEWFNDTHRGQIVCVRYRDFKDGEGYLCCECGIAKLNPKESKYYNILEGAKVSFGRAMEYLNRNERTKAWEMFHKKFGVGTCQFYSL